VQIAEAALAEAQTGETDVAVAEAQLQIAQGQLVQAQAERDQLLAGVTAGELAMLAAQVDQAAAALELAEAALAESTLVAPFAGTVAALESSPGETVMPGQVVLTLADLDRLRVETNDLSERDVDQVVVGAPALVYVEALGTTVQGEVVGIEPRSSTIGGDVVYRVVVALEEAPPDLRWGMSADVEISTD
jgi:multidrug resistance efflux pump